MNEEAIDCKLKCSICTEPFRKPVSLQLCRHTFCKKCILKWLRSKQNCPICRGTASQNDIERIRTRNFVHMCNNILVRCTHCNQINIHYGDMASHLQSCPKVTVLCPAANMQCQWRGLRMELAQHNKICTYQKSPSDIQELLNEAHSEVEKQVSVCNELRSRISTMQRRLEEQNRFIRAFFNNGHPMSDCCLALQPNECQVMNRVKDINGMRNNRRSDVNICLVCSCTLSSSYISLHHCEGGCICKACVKKYYHDSRNTNANNQERRIFDEPSHFVRQRSTSSPHLPQINVSMTPRTPRTLNITRTGLVTSYRSRSRHTDE